MENIGVSVGVVIDEFKEKVEGVMMSDDGTGGGIRIPSMLISKNDGDVLIDWLKTASVADKNQLVLMADFVLPTEADNKVEYDFWMTSSSNRALDFLEDFSHFQKRLGENLSFSPHYVFWECNNCDNRFIEKDCWAGGKYCAIETTNDAISGRNIILEDLRQKCLFNDLNDSGDQMKWFDYIKRVHATCYSNINEDCSRNAHEHLSLDWQKTTKCVEDSFSVPQKRWDTLGCKNSIIDKEISHWKEYGTNIYPSIVINKKTYRG